MLYEKLNLQNGTTLDAKHLAHIEEGIHRNSLMATNGSTVTHEWYGTVLTVTSGSGTSSADLKGEKGDPPVKGKDYFTEAEKAEIVDAVLAALPTYNGEYEVTPSADNEVTLQTAQKLMDADVRVKKIPFYDVSNEQGGSTVYIGTEVL